jgi:hypothetical protein
MRDYPVVWSWGMIALAACALGSLSQAQEFVAPPNSLSFEDKGTLEGYQQGYMKIRDSKSELWLLKIVPETAITVVGEAEIDYLRPGLSIEFSGQLDKKLALAKPIEEIEIINPKGKPALGLFAEGDDGADSKPARNPGPGPYRVRAKLANYKDGELTVAIGSRRITGSLADEVKISFTSNDPSVAAVGDAVEVKAWYYDNGKPLAALNRAGTAWAEEITITLAKPLAPTGRKARQPDRTSKTTASQK